MMLQYMELKKQYPDCLLFFRLGDFYELFLDDALIGAKVLDITLTSRSRGKDGRIPMAGVPYHAVDSYLGKLIKAGYKVAMCEQMTPPDKKGLVERQVVRVVTPGTLIDQKMLSAKDNNYLLCLDVYQKKLGAALVDISTGELQVNHFEVPTNGALLTILNQLITHLQPSECIVAPSLFPDSDLVRLLQAVPDLHVFPFSDWVKTSLAIEKIISQQFSAKKKQPPARQLPVELLTEPAARIAMANLLHYLEHTQKSEPLHLQPVTKLLGDHYLQMDRSTIMNLELLNTLRQQHRSGSLLEVIDQTRTAMGGRLLKQWLLKPLIDLDQINLRLDSVSFLVENATLRETCIHELNQMHDVERLLARLSLGSGNPRDLKNLEQSLRQSLTVSRLLLTSKAPEFLITTLRSLESEMVELISLINDLLVDQPPLDPKAGGLIKPGVNTQLDTLHETTTHNRDWLVTFEAQERETTGISSLKVKYNQVFGFYIEISKANLHLAPSRYFRKQTLINAERFTTPELQEREKILLSAESQLQDIEFSLFTQLVKDILLHVSALQRLAQSIAQLDCLVSLAQVAFDQQYTRPIVTNDTQLEIKAGRHPVVEQLLSHHQFVPNDVCLDHQSQQLLLLTGPNMAGKSVLMRQVALITLLAHIGSFVPAQSATISITDQIFVRSGAADMITAGLSTFMVEMVETATILHQATARSLVIMDEIGRGTSTHDGISIAWAIAEYLVSHFQPGPKTLFATHYHELQALAEKFPKHIKKYHLAITRHDQALVFLYRLTPGGTSQSYGLAVAELAGVPTEVIRRAEELLEEIQHDNQLLMNDSPPSQPPSKTSSRSTVEAKLANLKIEDLTPLAALNLLAELKAKYGSEVSR